MAGQTSELPSQTKGAHDGVPPDPAAAATHCPRPLQVAHAPPQACAQQTPFEQIPDWH